MFREFLSKNRNTLIFIGVIILGWGMVRFLYDADKTEDYLNDPLIGQIYIFCEDELYAPMRLDSIGKEHLFLRNYTFFFSGALPEREQILTREFDLNFYAIYQQDELIRLFREGQLIYIYRQ